MNNLGTMDELLGGLDLEKVRAYLALNRWSRLNDFSDNYSIWVKEDAEALVPAHSGFADYRRRIIELLEVLQEAESRSCADIVEDIMNVFSDVLRVRLSIESQTRTISVKDGALAYQRVKDLLFAAAWSARSEQEARRFLQKARFGHSRKGSYVLTVISPEMQPAVNGQDGPSNFFPRKVFSLLAESLDALAEQNSSRASLPDWFHEGGRGRRIADLFLRALADLDQSTGDEGLTFSFLWSPMIGERTKPQCIHLVKNQARMLLESYQTQAAASLELRGVAYALLPDEELNSLVGSRVVVEGFVRSLTLEKGTGKSVALITGTIKGVHEEFRVTLVDGQQETAFEAFTKDKKVICEGILIAYGSGFMLHDLSRFALMLEG